MTNKNNFTNEWDEASELFEQEKYDEAIEMFDSIYEKYPDEHECLLKNGFSYSILKKPNKVIEYFEKYLAIEESERKEQKDEIRWGIYQNLGIAYGMLESSEGNLYKAYKYFQSAIEIEPKAKSFLYLGQISMELGEEGLAVNYWKTAAKKGSSEAILALNSRGYEI